MYHPDENNYSGDKLEVDIQKVRIKTKDNIELLGWFHNKNLKDYKTDKQISNRILKEIKNRIDYMLNVGLGYLTLNRKSNTLSGGETQRINLASSLGSSLVGSTYILDEPSIGLHSRDNNKLIKILKNLRDIGNTVIIVEHDEEIILSADHIIDIGPKAGSFGGEIVASGNLNSITKGDSLTSQYLNKVDKIEYSNKRKKSKYFIRVKGAKENNLKNFSA